MITDDNLSRLDEARAFVWLAIVAMTHEGKGGEPISNPTAEMVYTALHAAFGQIELVWDEMREALDTEGDAA